METLKILSKAASWNDLNKKLEELTKSNQTRLAGDIFELLVKYYLLTNPTYQSKLKNVWLLKEVKEGIKKKLNLPDQDEGIDIIAETKEGHFWAIQAKYRSDPNETLTLGGKGSLATFSNLAFRYCKNISHGLVCTTVNKPPKKIKLIKQVGFQTLESFLSLDDKNCEEWKLLVARSVGKIIKPNKLEPRPHQLEAIKETIEHFKSNDRGKILMPCGTGKSLAAFWIANEMKVKNVLIAVPSLALLQQTLKVWTREFLINNIQPDWLCVCSDNTVKEDQDSFVSYTYDLGIEVTTDKDEIRKFLKTKSKNIKVIFTTYQSGKVTAQASKGFTFDLGIFDEAHKTVGHQDKPMAHLIHQKNIKIKHRLFMTATERLFRADKDEYLSMDDVRDYGKIIYQLTFKEAINSNPPIISDYRIITFGISEPEIEEIYQDNKFLQVKKELKDITAREFATALALRKAIKDLKITNAISFHSSIKRAVNFKDQQSLITKIYPEYGSLKTFHVRGDMPTSERSSQMRLFEEGKGLMTNARCLTEGVDLPAIDCVCFTDPKRSKVDIVQAAGRALRLSPGKKFGYILIPIFIPADQDPETASKDNAFEEVVATVGALSTQDTRIAEYLRAVSEGRKPTGGSPVDGTISVNVLTKIDPDLFNKAIQLKIWDKIARINRLSYNDAKKYALSFNLKNYYQWTLHTKSKDFPKDIPKVPQFTYKKEWENWGKFLGTGNIYSKDFVSFKKAKKIISKYKLKSRDEYKVLFKKNKLINFPSDPRHIYNKTKEWVGWGDFLNSGFIATRFRKYVSYKVARKFSRSLKLNNQKEWIKYSASQNFPNYIPKKPEKSYKKKSSWISWPDFLGTKNIQRGRDKNPFVNYEIAKKFAVKNKLSSSSEWEIFTKKKNFPDNIPKTPDGFYKKKGSWKSWGDFLGTGSIQTQLISYLTYKQAQDIAAKEKITSAKKWFKFCMKQKKYKNLPRNANAVYKNEWKGWGEFLKTGLKRGQTNKVLLNKKN